MNNENTPKLKGSKKRELTSPEFDIEYKKNRFLSESSESDLNSSLNTDILYKETSAMNSEVGTNSSPMMTDPSLEPTAHASHITIPPSEMLKISEMLQVTFRGEIVHMVDSVVQGVLKGLQDQINSLEKTNLELQKENKSLVARVTVLESQADQAEQYSRRNCLRISGVQEEANENTDDFTLKVANDIGSNIQLNDIDRSHRIGNPNNKKRVKPRDIIVKFSTYRARLNFYKQRTALKECGYLGVFVNEDLTKKRSSLLYQARTLVKSERLKGAWSSDGTVLIKDTEDNVHRVTSLTDLVPFGYVPAVSGQPGKPVRPGGPDSVGQPDPASQPGPSESSGST